MRKYNRRNISQSMSSPLVSDDSLISRQRRPSSCNMREPSTHGLYPPRDISEKENSQSLSFKVPSCSNKDKTNNFRETPVRVAVLICSAMLGCLCRSVTTFVFNFDISSTIEISLLAVVMTFSQGIVLFSLYALHPRILKYCEAALNWVVLCWQPSSEVTRFISVDAQEEGAIRP